MKSHVWRPLYVVIAFVVALLVFRFFYVPNDFGSGKRGFMYAFHRKSNEGEWKAQPVKYGVTGKQKLHEYCRECHGNEVKVRSEDLHGIIPCEDYHGPALEDRGRVLGSCGEPGPDQAVLAALLDRIG